LNFLDGGNTPAMNLITVLLIVLIVLLLVGGIPWYRGRGRL
jgi:hypothetical protein